MTGVTEEKVGKSLFVDGRMSREVKKLNNLSKLLFNLVAKTLIPRVGTYEKLYASELILLLHLNEGRKITLPYMIMKHMVHAIEHNMGSSLCYPMLLSKLFKYFQFPLVGEEILDKERKFLSDKSIKAMKLSGSTPPLPSMFLTSSQSSSIPQPSLPQPPSQ
ncbi:hypothetical protein SESBI_44557 [Sesbania bispinosa]|nr:hypothetical protein SESBI_44557 [Sesbania bispinosa]